MREGFLRRGLKLHLFSLCLLVMRVEALGQKSSLQRSVLENQPSYHFDVVSITPNTSASGASYFSERPDGFFATNASLLSLIISAFDIRDGKIIGAPNWASTARFDVSAKVLSGKSYRELSQKQKEEMMQEVLASRFLLAAHVEMRESPVYELVRDKRGSKLQKIVDTKIRSDSYVSNRGSIHGSALSMSGLADELSSELNTDVIDATHLDGWYRIDLEWNPSDSPIGPDNGDSANKPSIYAALPEQLGIRLVPAKSKTRFLVIDHMGKLIPN